MSKGTRAAVLAASLFIPTVAFAQGPTPCPASVVDKQVEDDINAVVPAPDGGAFLIGTSGPSFNRTVARDLWVLRVDANGRAIDEKLIMTAPSQLVAGAVPLRAGGFAVAVGRSVKDGPSAVEVVRFNQTGAPIVGQSEVLDNAGMWDTPRDIAVSADGTRFAVVSSRAGQEFTVTQGCITFVDSSFPVTVQPDVNGIATPAAKTGRFCTSGALKSDFRAVEAIGPGRWGVLATVQDSPKKTDGRMRYLVIDETAGVVLDKRIPSSLVREEAAELVRLSDGSLAAIGTAFGGSSARGWVAHIDASGNIIKSKLVGPKTPISKTKNDGWSLGAAVATSDGGVVLAGTRWSRHVSSKATRGWVVRLDRSLQVVMESELEPTDDLAITSVWLGVDGRVRIAGRNQKPSSADHDGWSAIVASGSGDVCEVQLR